MSTIRVLHVIARMNVGGTARYVGDLVENLPNSALATGYVQGAEIEDPVVSTIDPYRILHLGRKVSPINDFRAWVELRRLIGEMEPDVIHTHTFKAGLIGRLVRGNHKRVHTFHGHLFDDQSFSSLQKKVITWAEQYLAKRTDYFISVGEKVGEEIRSAGIGRNKVWASIAPGVSKLPLLDKLEARKKLGLDSQVFLVGWMARMTSVKNPRLLLDVARILPEVQFVMAGGGDLLDQIRLDAPNNVRVIGWADSSAFWSAVDLAVSTSDNEGMPIALIEAQLAGVPVVATDVGSNSEVIANGITGLVTDKNMKSLSIGLQSIISNPTQLTSMAMAAQGFAAKKFSSQEMLNAHLNIYRQL